jgi:hypothetical protein
MDQLLTGYLDDVLSGDERDRVEKLLKTNPSVAEELAQLQSLRTTLQAVLLADSDIRLDAGFADRVIDEAVARARVEGVSEDHPLMRLEDQPSSSLSPTTSSSWRIAAVMVGLAASIALAVMLLRPKDREAQGESNPQNSQIAQINPPQFVPETPEAIVPLDGNLRPTPDMTAVASPETSPVPVVEPVTPSPEAGNIENGTSEAGIGSIAVTTGPTMKAADPPADVVNVTPEQTPAALGVILVFNVELTDTGKDQEAFKSAMQLAGLKLSGTKKITEEVAGFVEKPSLEKSDGALVLYLHAPAKDLDRLYLGLIADTAGVKSVGMSLAMNAPVIRTVNSVRQDPTRIRHESASLQLLSDDDSIAQLTETLWKLEYMSVRGGKTIPSSGTDEMAEVLLLVR